MEFDRTLVDEARVRAELEKLGLPLKRSVRPWPPTDTMRTRTMSMRRTRTRTKALPKGTTMPSRATTATANRDMTTPAMPTTTAARSARSPN